MVQTMASQYKLRISVSIDINLTASRSRFATDRESLIQVIRHLIKIKRKI